MKSEQIALADIVVSKVEDLHYMTQGLIKADCKDWTVTLPRNMCFYLIHHITGLSHVEIGEYFDISRNSVANGIKSIHKLQSINTPLKNRLHGIQEQIKKHSFQLP